MPRVVLRDMTKQSQNVAIAHGDGARVPAPTAGGAVAARIGQQLCHLYPLALAGIVEPAAPVPPERESVSMACTPGLGAADDQQPSVGSEGVSGAEYIAVG